MKRILNFKNVVIILLIFLGLFLRFYKLSERTTFDADQEWLAFRAIDILKGDIVLLGPVTSVGNFSIGPGYVYLTAILTFLLNNNPIAGAILSVFLGVLTSIAIFYFINRFVDKKVAFILLYLTCISFTFILWDQNPWTPSLFYLLQTLLLIGAYLSLKNEYAYIIMATALVMGFQSHLGIVLSLISIFIYLLIVKPIKPRRIIIFYSILIIFLGILPNLIFDISHNFINLKRLVEIASGDGLDYFIGFGRIINVLSNNLVSIIYPRQINILDNIIIKIVFTIILVNCISCLRNKKFRNLSILLLITTIVPSLFFYIQQGKFSEYYLMMTQPSLVIMMALAIYNLLLNKKMLILFILLLSTYLNLRSIINYKKSFNLKSKMDVVEFIINKAGKENYGISLSTRHGDQFGFNYIFYYFGINADIPPKKGETRIFSIIFPEGFEGMNGMKDFDGIGLRWQGI